MKRIINTRNRIVNLSRKNEEKKTNSSYTRVDDDEIVTLLVCMGYLRQFKIFMRIHINDIASIILKYAKDTDWAWTFDYLYDCAHRGSLYHRINESGKTLECEWSNVCDCFYRVNHAMTPKSGIYKIKMKIDEIYTNSRLNVIGITCNVHPTNNSQHVNKNRWYCSTDYIGWSCNSRWDRQDKLLRHGLLCGFDEKCQKNNIFLQSGFEYHSNNNNYVERLPGFQRGDIILLKYDSNGSALYFSKCNHDNVDTLDSYICNLPKNQTFYWFVGHNYSYTKVTIIPCNQTQCPLVMPWPCEENSNRSTID